MYDDDIKMYNLIYTYIVSKGTFNLFISYIQSINRENFIRKQHKVLIYNIPVCGLLRFDRSDEYK